MRRREFLLGSAVLAACRSRGTSEHGMSILNAQVVAADGHASTANYFALTVEDLTGKKLDVTTSAPSQDNRPLVLIGDVESSARIRELAGPARIAKLGPQGILLATVTDAARPVLLVAGATRAATPGAAGELLNFHLDAGPNGASAPPLDSVENPALPYRIFWNWDHSTNWARGVRGEQEDGCFNPYLKPAGAYLNDFRRVADFIAEHKLNGLIVWGFLRDGHGGVAESKKLVEHAAERGVRILPGIGSSFYGGIYYEGNHRFNVNTWLSSNPPQLRFLDGAGKRLHNAICPSQPKNVKWLREGAEWLFSEFPKLGGVNLENGDFFACQCEGCRRMRKKPENDPNFYWDMMVTQLPIIEASRKLLPGAWMTYATYTGFNRDEIWKRTGKSLIRSEVPRFVSQFPEDAICQWTLTHMVEGWGREPEAEVRKKWPAGLGPPTKHSIGLLHQGSVWHRATEWWTKPPKRNDTGQRYVDISELIRYTCLRCAEEGIEGLEILGEASDDSPAAELNYLAFEEFTWRPRTTMDSFVQNRLARIYGSAAAAGRYLRIVRSSEPTLPALLKDFHAADETSNNRQFNARQRRRWVNLRAELARRISFLV